MQISFQGVGGSICSFTSPWAAGRIDSVSLKQRRCTCLSLSGSRNQEQLPATARGVPSPQHAAIAEELNFRGPGRLRVAKFARASMQRIASTASMGECDLLVSPQDHEFASM